MFCDNLLVRGAKVSNKANKESQPKIYFENEISDKLKQYDIRMTDQGIGFAVPKEWLGEKPHKKYRKL